MSQSITVIENSADVSLVVDIRNTYNKALTGLVYNSTGLTCYYARPGEASVSIALATQTAAGTHADGGFVEIDATNAPGIYRLDLPDAVCNMTLGAQTAFVYLRGAATMADTPVRINLVEGPMTSVLAESYAMSGTEATMAELLYEICQGLTEVRRSGTTLTAYKRDHVQVAAKWELDNAADTTSRTRIS